MLLLLATILLEFVSFPIWHWHNWNPFKIEDLHVLKNCAPCWFSAHKMRWCINFNANFVSIYLHKCIQTIISFCEHLFIWLNTNKRQFRNDWKSDMHHGTFSEVVGAIWCWTSSPLVIDANDEVETILPMWNHPLSPDKHLQIRHWIVMAQQHQPLHTTKQCLTSLGCWIFQGGMQTQTT